MNTKIIITSPSLNPEINVSGISSVTQFIINSNDRNQYIHFELGKSDTGKRNIYWLFNLLKKYWSWGYLLFEKRKALIHFNLALDKRGLMRDSPLILIARMLQKRMIIHIHGGEALTNDHNPAWIKKIIRLILSGPNPKIVLGSQERDTLKRIISRDNIFILPNCVELADANKFVRQYNDAQCLTILFMGRIVPTKGIDYIYEALKTLKSNGTAFKFIMAGKGPDEDLYIRKFSDLLGGDFEFKGVVYGNKKAELLRDSEVFLLPSFFEGLPIALLEAMSFGLAPVTTNVGSIKYLVNADNGIFIERFSSDDIVSAIGKLASDRVFFKKLSMNARESVFSNYNPTSYLSKLNEIYQYE